MQLSEMGEFGLIQSIQNKKPIENPVVVGIGDDCAVLPLDEENYQLLSCDLLMEGVHFLRDKITPYALGYKSVAVNLSDVAAMGGVPQYILLSIALPGDYTVEEWQELYRGITDICRKYHVDILGGDTTSSRSGLAINVTVVGKTKKDNLHLRRDAKPGDVIFVTGPLGGSRAGLELLLHPDIPVEADQRAQALQQHCMPEPCVEEVSILNRIAGTALHALNDISDGLFSEAGEIAEASQVRCELAEAQISVHPSCGEIATAVGANPMDWACRGGEDYQLVGTLDGQMAEGIAEAYKKETGNNLYLVGKITAGEGVFLQEKNGSVRKIEERGYNHFE